MENRDHIGARPTCEGLVCWSECAALTNDDLRVATYLNLQYGGGAGVVDGMAGQV